MIRTIFLAIAVSFFAGNLYAFSDTIKVPIQRQLFHDKINEEQKLIDKADGKQDGLVRVCANNDINIAVTDVMFRSINELQDSVETNTRIPNHKEKVLYLSLIHI